MLFVLLPAALLRAEQVNAAALAPTVPPAATGEPPAAPSATAAEPLALSELRRQSLATVATLLATRTEPFQIDLLVDGTPKLVELVAVDKDLALHYKQYGRPGQIAFADLTASQIAGLMTALLPATGEETKGVPLAYLQTGLLYRVLGKDLESASAIAKAVDLDPDLEATLAERLKALPQPPPPPTAPTYPLPATDTATTNSSAADSAASALANGPGGARATDLSVAPTAASWPPKELPVAAGRRRYPGLYGSVGPDTHPNRVNELTIDHSGVYENYLVDGGFANHNLVNIKADSVVFRNSEVRNSCNNGVQVYAKDVLIENCRIHNLANGSAKASMDAHGITGCPTRLVIRNCAIYAFSGDGIQFDPERHPWTDVVVEHCEIWLTPFDRNIAGWKQGETAGENALDTKTDRKAKRARVIVRHSVFHGFAGAEPTAGIRAALNLKENIDATVEDCVFYDNDLSLRLRGPGQNGGAKVTASDCYFYRGADAIRYENDIQGLALTNMAFGNDITNRYDKTSAAAKDLRITGDRTAPALNDMRPPKPR